MARKVIDVGAVGNDGTGDSIRESFQKVNENFRELYSSLGLGERLTLIGLDDTPATYLGNEAAVLAVNPTTDGVMFKNIVGGIGVAVDTDSNSSEISISTEFSEISGDTTPQLGGNLDTNDNNIVTVSNRDLNLYPNGTGAVEIGGNTNPGTVILNCESNSHGIKLQSPPHSAGQSYTLKFPTGNVTADRFLKVASITGSGTTAVGQLSFAEVSGGTSWQAVKTSTFTAVAGEGYFINTTAGAIEMDLPAGNIGDEVSFIDYAGTFDTNALTIDQNGSEKIAGSTDPLTVSTERAANTLVYVDSTQGWLLKNN